MNLQGKIGVLMLFNSTVLILNILGIFETLELCEQIFTTHFSTTIGPLDYRIILSAHMNVQIIDVFRETECSNMIQMLASDSMVSTFFLFSL